MKIALVDDRRVIRAGIIQMLEPYPEIHVIEIPASFPAPDRIWDLMPEVVILGNADKYQDTAQMIRQVKSCRQSSEYPRVLLLRDVKTQGEAVQIMAMGAQGYVPSSIDGSQLASALVIVGAGGQALLPGLAVSAAPDADGTESDPGAAGLTQREFLVLSALGRGLSNSEIARELEVSEATVKKHLSSVMRKTGQRDRLRAGLYAYRHGVGLSLNSMAAKYAGYQSLIAVPTRRAAEGSRASRKNPGLVRAGASAARHDPGR